MRGHARHERVCVVAGKRRAQACPVKEVRVRRPCGCRRQQCVEQAQAGMRKRQCAR